MKNISKADKIILVTFLAVICITVWTVRLAVNSSQKKLSVSFLDVGQGDSTLIETPSGNDILIDGGSAGSVNRPLSSQLPFYDRGLDMVIASHADADHIGGFPAVLDNYDVDTIIPPARPNRTAVWTAFLNSVQREKRQGANVFKATAGRVFRLDEQVYLLTLAPPRSATPMDTNESSIVLKLIYGDASLVLPGDISKEMETFLAGRYGDLLSADILKAAHHGSDTSSGNAFLSVVSPQTVVFSAGTKNRHGHPSPEVVDRVRSIGASSTCTCENGTVTFSSEGETFQRLD